MNNKTILLIGSSGGIGAKVAEILLGEGYKVIGTYNTNKQEGVASSNSNFKEIPCDLKHSDSIKKLHEEIAGEKL